MLELGVCITQHTVPGNLSPAWYSLLACRLAVKAVRASHYLAGLRCLLPASQPGTGLTHLHPVVQCVVLAVCPRLQLGGQPKTNTV